MSKPATLEKYRKLIFEDFGDIALSPAEEYQLKRIRAVYTLQLDRPSVLNKELVSMLRSEFDVSLSQAYRDIANTQTLLGSVPNASKQWIRYMVVEALKDVMARVDVILAAYLDGESDAMLTDNDSITKALEVKVKAADKLAKYARLNIADTDPLPFDEIVPQPIEYCNEPSILTGKVIDDPVAYVEKIKKKYIDAEFEEIDG